ncbi:OLC1v1032185C1 [Oldenlandia corymbosa var. corymbosa]|uniref:OLC1v1032185C1 n=1 Tax=Oldenlandia corymbosa var. corymbosa TaxID=529605 RepID=A0AAV1CLU9_OLDCO|nr:OLC1v1032185C1 [Oldenlandia corymbosa var. corymbosa]
MGLQNQLTDFSAESLPILMVALIGNCVGYLRSIFILVFQALGFSLATFDGHQNDNALCDLVGSGLTGVIMLAEQLNLNRMFSYDFDGGCRSGMTDCVFCLNRFQDGDRVRTLACRHVFHKHCFDGWLDQLKFDCPLCREPLVEDERVSLTSQRVTEDMLAWFSTQ